MQIVAIIYPEEHYEAYSHNLLVYSTEHGIDRPACFCILLNDILLKLVSYFLKNIKVREMDGAFFGQVLFEFKISSNSYNFIILVQINLNKLRDTKLRKVSAAMVPFYLSSFCHSIISLVLSYINL